jgi:prolyl oligopeptidase
MATFRISPCSISAYTPTGGEYGEELWYKQGKLDKKQNCFDDFQWAAKWLISNKYTSPKRLAINGGSNGGLLVGACVNQAPELFGCGVAEVGVLDMLRFHRFTIGHAWTSDYGNPEVLKDFEMLLTYSPLHNVRKGRAYPAVLIMTGDHDDRVVPLHSLKFLATLQHEVGVQGANVAPLMGRIETKAGHGAGKSTAQRIEEASDKFAFIGKVLGAEWRE